MEMYSFANASNPWQPNYNPNSHGPAYCPSSSYFQPETPFDVDLILKIKGIHKTNYNEDFDCHFARYHENIYCCLGEKDIFLKISRINHSCGPNSDFWRNCEDGADYPKDEKYNYSLEKLEIRATSGARSSLSQYRL